MGAIQLQRGADDAVKLEVASTPVSCERERQSVLERGTAEAQGRWRRWRIGRRLGSKRQTAASHSHLYLPWR
jgi:hypothetical protein